jgi:hypothetical protein
MALISLDSLKTMYSSDDDDNLNFEYDDVAEQQLQPRVKMWENLCIEEKIRY